MSEKREDVSDPDRAVVPRPERLTGGAAGGSPTDDPIEAAYQRLADLNVLRDIREKQIASLGSTLGDARRHVDATGMRLYLTNLETKRLKEEIAALQDRIAQLEGEASSLQAQVADKEALVVSMESSRAWRLRNRLVRARASVRSILHGASPSPSVPAEAPGEAPADAPVPAVPASNPRAVPAAPISGTEMGSGRAVARTVGASFEPARAAKSVVFVSDDAEPHGAQTYLLRLLRWFRDRSDLAFEIILGGGGALQADFEAIARVSSLQHHGPSRLPDDDPVVRRLRAANVGLIYSNAITNGRLLGALAGIACPVLTHVHELGYRIGNHATSEDLKIVRDRTTRFIAVSNAVRRTLVDELGIPSGNVTVVYGFVPVGANAYVRVLEPGQIREELGIPAESHIVAGSGTLDWRKAPDLFVQLALQVRQRVSGRPVHFLWVGDSEDAHARAGLWHDVVRSGLADSTHFVGHRDNHQDYFRACDVFALTSREDPYPLVVLEAATCAVPTVCFDASGGAREFVAEDCGFVVPYLDVATMADRVAEILTQPALRRRLGLRAEEKVAERHDIDVVAPLLLKEITALRETGASAEARPTTV